MHAGAITSSATTPMVRTDGHVSHNHKPAAPAVAPAQAHDHAPKPQLPGRVDVCA